jgi:enoyl-CoA hydratase/carnithine racemase
VDLKVTTYEVTERVGVITLSRPDRLNAWTGRMHAEYRWCLERADTDPGVRVIVVTGAGRGFCAGADAAALDGHAQRGGYEAGLPDEPARPGFGTDARFDADFAYHFGLATPTIAAVNGPAAGVGFVLACCCDLRFAAAGAKLTTAHGKLNLPAEYGLSWLLPRLIGMGRAMDLLLTSRVVLAEEALAMGLVNRVLPPDRLVPATIEFAQDLAASVSRRSLTETRRQVWLDQHRDARSSVEAAAVLLEEMMTEPDFRRGVQALLDRTSPEFP